MQRLKGAAVPFLLCYAAATSVLGFLIRCLRRIGFGIRLGIELGEEGVHVAILRGHEFMEEFDQLLGEGVVGILFDVGEEERAGDDLAAGFAFALLGSFARVESLDLGDEFVLLLDETGAFLSGESLGMGGFPLGEDP